MSVHLLRPHLLPCVRPVCSACPRAFWVGLTFFKVDSASDESASDDDDDDDDDDAEAEIGSALIIVLISPPPNISF